MRKKEFEKRKRELAKRGILGTFAAIIAVPVAMTLHELGHALGALLTGNIVHKIYLDFINISGYVTITIKNAKPYTMKIILWSAYVLPTIIFGTVLYYAYKIESTILIIFAIMGLFVTFRWFMIWGK